MVGGAPVSFSVNQTHLPFPAHGRGHLHENSGKYPQPPAAAAALYATPNATISTLLPYNGLPPSAAAAAPPPVQNYPPLTTSSIQYNLYPPPVSQPIHTTYPPNSATVYPYPPPPAHLQSPAYPTHHHQKAQTYYPPAPAGYPPYPPPGAPAGYPSVTPSGSFCKPGRPLSSEYHSQTNSIYSQPQLSVGVYPPPPAGTATYPPRPY